MAPVRSSLSFERNAVLHEMLPVGFELQKLPEPLQFAWLRSAAVARYEDRGAMCTFFFFTSCAAKRVDARRCEIHITHGLVRHRRTEEQHAKNVILLCFWDVCSARRECIRSRRSHVSKCGSLM